MKRRVQYDPRKDYYQILGVEAKATQPELQQAYRQKAKTVHPDRNPERHEWATEQFQLLNEAYDVLGNQGLRSAYDDQRYRFHPDGENWWDKPHQAEPGYSGVHYSYTPYTPRPRPGAWLERYYLGSFRPFYAAVIDLWYSPYWFVLLFLTLVVIGLLLVVFVLVPSEAGDESNAAAIPTQTLIQSHTVEAVEGIIPTTITLSECDNLQLTIIQVERPSVLIKITAQASDPNLSSRNVQFAPIEIDGDTIRQVGEWEAVNLIFDIEANIVEQPLFSNIEAGDYVLRWTPVLPTPQTPAVCDQIVPVQ